MDGYPERLSLGPLSLRLIYGDPRRICFAGTEVLRRLSCPVRDENWGTVLVVDTSVTCEASEDRLWFARDFADPDGAFEGRFTLRAQATDTSARIEATFRLTALRPFRTNRAGLTLLHPIAGVAGQPMQVRHPDGSTEALAFPDRIRPSQPAFGIAGLSHRIGPVAVDLAMTGEVFEMEDQRNWSDASYKTYCRPLSAPRPFALAAGEVLAQTVTLDLAWVGGAPARPSAPVSAPRLPALALAAEPGLSAGLSAPGLDLPILLRLGPDAPDPVLAAARGRAGLTLEIVLPAGPDPAHSLGDLARRCAAQGLAPARVVALPEAYLKSYQPEGPWPEGPAPRDLIAPLRAAFPQAQVGSGSLTNFTELNRCPPAPEADFVTFGTTAIVHAADDLSVLETLEALPAIFQSAHALAPGKPLHLGLFSIGMRSNPYGADMIANPRLVPLPMARQDPRQTGRFAGAWAAGVLAAAAENRVDSLALSMPDGPLGCLAGGGVTPLYHVIRWAAAHAGQPVRIDRAVEGLLTFDTAGGGALTVHLGDAACDHTPHGAARHLDEAARAAAADPGWLQNAPRLHGPVRMAPGDLLFSEGVRA